MGGGLVREGARCGHMMGAGEGGGEVYVGSW